MWDLKSWLWEASVNGKILKGSRFDSVPMRELSQLWEVPAMQSLAVEGLLWSDVRFKPPVQVLPVRKMGLWFAETGLLGILYEVGGWSGSRTQEQIAVILPFFLLLSSLMSDTNWEQQTCWSDSCPTYRPSGPDSPFLFPALSNFHPWQLLLLFLLWFSTSAAAIAVYDALVWMWSTAVAGSCF